MKKRTIDAILPDISPDDLDDYDDEEGYPSSYPLPSPGPAPTPLAARVPPRHVSAIDATFPDISPDDLDDYDDEDGYPSSSPVPSPGPAPVPSPVPPRHVGFTNFTIIMGLLGIVSVIIGVFFPPVLVISAISLIAVVNAVYWSSKEGWV